MVLETLPICAVRLVDAGSGCRASVLTLQVLFETETFGHPIILENSTGLVFKATFPATAATGTL